MDEIPRLCCSTSEKSASFLVNPWLSSYPSSGDAKHKAQCFNAQKDDGRGEKPSTAGITVPFLGKNHDDVENQGINQGINNSENQGLWRIWMEFLSVSMFGFQHCERRVIGHRIQGTTWIMEGSVSF